MKSQKLAKLLNATAVNPIEHLPDPARLQAILPFLKMHASKRFKLNAQYLLSMTQWMDKALPTITREFNRAQHNNKYFDLFAFCQKLKYHRSTLFDMAQKQLNSFELAKLNLAEMTKIYETSILLKHPTNQSFMADVRTAIQTRLIQIKDIQRNSVESMCVFLQSLMLDTKISSQQKSQIITKLHDQIQSSVNSMEMIKLSRPHIISNLFEQSKLYKVGLPHKFHNFTQQAHGSLEANINKADRLRMKNTASSQSEMQILNNKNDDNVYHMSTFERIFKNFLNSAGYDSEFNITFKGNEYDVLVKGINRTKYCPLRGIKLGEPHKSDKQFDLKLLSYLSKSRQLQNFPVSQKLVHPTILNLNGPTHYISSDLFPLQSHTITRKEQFKYEKLSLYGIERYNLINYEEWEFDNRGDKKRLQYIKNKINTARSTRPTDAQTQNSAPS